MENNHQLQDVERIFLEKIVRFFITPKTESTFSSTQQTHWRLRGEKNADLMFSGNIRK